MLLERITSPADVKAFDAAEIPALCAEIRSAILTSSASAGGHVGSNLGVVELTVALHRVFDSPADKLIFDVSHQTYTHKMLTGRAEFYLDSSRFGAVSGFSNPNESPHDLFSMGHTSTSVSLACGLAKARDLAGEHHDVVAVIGDGSLSGGLAFEGLDALAELESGAIVIVNDNGWSIAENHGGIYRNLAELRESHGTCANNIFRALGLDYRFLAEGNDEAAVERELRELRGCTHPIVLHLCTVKGEGYEPAERDAENWHHVGPFDLASGACEPLRRSCCETPETYASITGAHLLLRMASDPAVVGISAATPYIIGFTPERRAAAGAQFVDVGIAEEHAITYAAGLAQAGAKPVVGLYGVFMQRAYDEFWHDLCLNNAPAVVLDFGASVFGTADATHLSFFDLALMQGMPNLRCLAPVCREEYLTMLDWALDQRECPVVIRVPSNGVTSRPELAPAMGTAFNTPSYQLVRSGSRVAILALGDFFELGERVADTLASRAHVQATLVNPRFATELDEKFLRELVARHSVIITLEDGILEGGWGASVARFLGPLDVRTRCYGIRRGFPDRFCANELLEQNGITVEGIVHDILNML